MIEMSWDLRPYNPLPAWVRGWVGRRPDTEATYGKQPPPASRMRCASWPSGCDRGGKPEPIKILGFGLMTERRSSHDLGVPDARHVVR
jgi:hypothetical protein